VDRESFEHKLPAMAEAAIASGSPQNNPIVPSAAEIIELYRRVW
jgi:alcohol dehydrogenase